MIAESFPNNSLKNLTWSGVSSANFEFRCISGYVSDVNLTVFEELVVLLDVLSVSSVEAVLCHRIWGRALNCREHVDGATRALRRARATLDRLAILKRIN